MSNGNNMKIDDDVGEKVDEMLTTRIMHISNGVAVDECFEGEKNNDGTTGNVATGHPADKNVDHLNVVTPNDDPNNDSNDESGDATESTINGLLDNEMDGMGSNDDEILDPSGSGAGDAIPQEPGFIDRFAARFSHILNDENANFQEFCSVADDFILNLKKELNFKNRNDDVAVRPIKNIDPSNPSEIQKLYKKNRKKALRLIYNEEYDFCTLDPEEVANHYDTVAQDPSINTEFMMEGDPAASKFNSLPFTKVEVSKKLKACDNTSPGPDGIT